MSCPQVDDRQKDRRCFRAGVCTASATESLTCRGSSAHVDTSSSGSTTAGRVLLGHEAPKQLSRSLCMAGRHRMRMRLRPRASSLRFLSWKTRRRLALRRCLEFGDVEGASASGSSGRAVRAGRADWHGQGDAKYTPLLVPKGGAWRTVKLFKVYLRLLRARADLPSPCSPSHLCLLPSPRGWRCRTRRCSAPSRPRCRRTATRTRRSAGRTTSSLVRSADCTRTLA